MNPINESVIKIFGFIEFDPSINYRMISLLFDYLSNSDEENIKPYAILLDRVQR